MTAARDVERLQQGMDAVSLSMDPSEAKNQAIALLLVAKLRELPRDSLHDLLELSAALTECQNEEELAEIIETVWEIMFPERLGEVRDRSSESRECPPKLKKRMQWIGAKIKEERKTRGMTQEDLAKASGLPQSHISRLEAGQYSPAYKTLEKLAQAFGVDIGVLDPASG